MDKEIFNEEYERLSAENLKAVILDRKNYSYYPLFKRDIKKIREREILLKILWGILLIKEDYTIGDMKKDDLRGVRTYNFKYKNKDYRLMYYVVEDDKKSIKIIFLSIQIHENVYKNLKNYLNSNKQLLKEIKMYGI